MDRGLMMNSLKLKARLGKTKQTNKHKNKTPKERERGEVLSQRANIMIHEHLRAQGKSVWGFFFFLME